MVTINADVMTKKDSLSKNELPQGVEQQMYDLYQDKVGVGVSLRGNEWLACHLEQKRRMTEEYNSLVTEPHEKFQEDEWTMYVHESFEQEKAKKPFLTPYAWHSVYRSKHIRKLGEDAGLLKVTRLYAERPLGRQLMASDDILSPSAYRELFTRDPSNVRPEWFCLDMGLMSEVKCARNLSTFCSIMRDTYGSIFAEELTKHAARVTARVMQDVKTFFFGTKNFPETRVITPDDVWAKTIIHTQGALKSLCNTCCKIAKEEAALKDAPPDLRQKVDEMISAEFKKLQDAFPAEPRGMTVFQVTMQIPTFVAFSWSEALGVPQFWTARTYYSSDCKAYYTVGCKNEHADEVEAWLIRNGFKRGDKDYFKVIGSEVACHTLKDFPGEVDLNIPSERLWYSARAHLNSKIHSYSPFYAYATVEDSENPTRKVIVVALPCAVVGSLRKKSTNIESTQFYASISNTFTALRASDFRYEYNPSALPTTKKKPKDKKNKHNDDDDVNDNDNDNTATFNNEGYDAAKGNQPQPQQPFQPFQPSSPLPPPSSSGGAGAGAFGASGNGNGNGWGGNTFVPPPPASSCKQKDNFDNGFGNHTANGCGLVSPDENPYSGYQLPPPPPPSSSQQQQQQQQLQGPFQPTGAREKEQPQQQPQQQQQPKKKYANRSGLEFCDDPFRCKIANNKQNTQYDDHTKKYRHVCPFGKDCRSIRDPDHARMFAHINKPDCPNGKSCTEIGSRDHRDKYHHPPPCWDYMIRCTRDGCGQECSWSNPRHINYTHKKLRSLAIDEFEYFD